MNKLAIDNFSGERQKTALAIVQHCNPIVLTFIPTWKDNNRLKEDTLRKAQSLIKSRQTTKSGFIFHFIERL